MTETNPARFVATPEEASLRLDAFLVRRGAAVSAGAARRLVEAGLVRLGGRPARKGARLAAGDLVEVALESRPVLAPDATMRLEVLFVDDHLLAVNKPAGVPSHPLRVGEVGTVASALAATHPECAAASPDPREGGLAHRLDTGTSGVLIAARTAEAWPQLRAVLAGDDCAKTYVAEVLGVPGAGDLPDLARREGDGFRVEAAIGRVGRRGGRVRLEGGRGVLPASTHVQVRERRGQTTLVEARLTHGRAHQVRAHLAYLGVPVVGDPTYGSGAPGDTLHLHAWQVELLHPITGARLHLTAPLPPWAARA